MPLDRTVPALPVASVVAAAEAYGTRLGFRTVHLDGGTFAIVARDEAELHLWQTTDTGWRVRPADELAAGPVVTGAEDFLAGTASCRIACTNAGEIDGLHTELAATGALHPSDPGAPVETAWGTREVHALDLDGNLLTFFVRTGTPSAGP